MPTSKTWPGGASTPTPAAYSIPATGELNWAAVADFLNALGDGAQATSFQKYAVRKAVTSPVTVAAGTDCVVATDLTVAGPVTVNLPAGANKQVFIIVDGKGDAGTNNVTINRNGSDTIAGGTTFVLSQNRQSVILIYNSADTDWKIAANCAAGFSDPLTTRGDINYRNSANVTSRLPVGSANTVLTSNGTDPSYIQVTNAYVDAAAAIAYSKLNLGTSIVNADINAAAAIAYSKLNLSTSIVNADINASAAIAGTKVDPAFGAQNVSTTGTISTGAATLGPAAALTTAHIIQAQRADGTVQEIKDTNSASAFTKYTTSGGVTGFSGSNTTNSFYAINGAGSIDIIAVNQSGIGTYTADTNTSIVRNDINKDAGNNAYVVVKTGSGPTTRGAYGATATYSFEVLDNNLGNSVFNVKPNGEMGGLITNWSSSATQDIGFSVTTGAGVFHKFTSSARYKEEIAPLSFDSSAIYAMNAKQFKWKTGGGLDFGFIAEEVNEVLPQAVNYMSDEHGLLLEDGRPIPEAVKYRQLTALLVEEMKKLRARIEVLEAQG